MWISPGQQAQVYWCTNVCESHLANRHSCTTVLWTLTGQRTQVYWCTSIQYVNLTWPTDEGRLVYTNPNWPTDTGVLVYLCVWTSPGQQTQVYWLTPSWQVALFWQGADAHSRISSSHSSPMKPVPLQSHSNLSITHTPQGSGETKTHLCDHRPWPWD